MMAAVVLLGVVERLLVCEPSPCALAERHADERR